MKGLCHIAGLLYIFMLLRALGSSVHSSDETKYFAVYFHQSVLCFWRGEMLGVRVKARFSSVRRLGGIKQRFAYTPQEGAVKIAQIGVLPCKHVLFCCGISGFKYLNIIYFLYKHFFVVIAAPFRMSCSLSFTRAGLSARETTSIVVHSLAKCLFTAVQSTMKCSTLLSRTAGDADC